MDEIGEISWPLQVKLLRAIEGGGFSPLGSRQTLHPDFRIIAASNKNLADLVKAGKMREDFFFRVHVIPIHLPPLRERGDDVFLLIDHFLKLFSKTDKLTTLKKEDLTTLRNYHWPGNIRELQNVLRRYAMLRTLDFLRTSKDEGSREGKACGEDGQLEKHSLRRAVEHFEKSFIMSALEQNQWHKGKTARHLQVCRKTLYDKMRYHGLL